MAGKNKFGFAPIQAGAGFLAGMGLMYILNATPKNDTDSGLHIKEKNPVVKTSTGYGPAVDVEGPMAAGGFAADSEPIKDPVKEQQLRNQSLSTQYQSKFGEPIYQILQEYKDAGYDLPSGFKAKVVVENGKVVAGESKILGNVHDDIKSSLLESIAMDVDVDDIKDKATLNLSYSIDQ